ncbi:MAG: endonuclease III [Pseudomonadales bacterium]
MARSGGKTPDRGSADGSEVDLLSVAEVEELYRTLAREMPGRVAGAKGPKGQPDAFRACVSCILSAQSRDDRTAAASRALFRRARTPRTVLSLSAAEIVEAIRPCGLYNRKARSIHRFCEALLNRHGGRVPDTREALMALPGIGRKCADIVLSFVFDQDTIAVDTHVHRVCNRTGLARGRSEPQTAVALERRTPAWALRDGHFWLIQFGRRVCSARSPGCDSCPVNHLCHAYRATQCQ